MKILSFRLLWTLMAVVVLSVFCAGAAFADYAYYFPYFSSSDSKGEVIGLALTNADGVKNDVKIVIKDQGGVTRKVEYWKLAPFGQQNAVIGADLDEVEGSFQVVSTRPLTGLAFLFTQQMTVMYDLPMTQSPVNKLDIPHTAQDTEWGMRIFVNNPKAKAVSVDITYRDGAGVGTISAYEVNLDAYGSAVINLADLLTYWNLPELSGGCLHLVTDGSGIVAFATYDSLKSGGSFYAGLEAVDPTKQLIRPQYAVVSCSAPGYTSGAHALIEVEKPRSVQENLLPTISDIKMAAQGEHFYRIDRRNGNVTKFSATVPAAPIWQYSVEASNPQSMIFVSESKAYITRLGSTKMWIVNPATTTEANFKIGEVELADYADADGSPDMTKGVVVGGKLFLLLQRLEYWVPQTAYLVVIDTESNIEIDTQNGAANLKGIPLPVKNPWDIVYRDGKIYLNGVGNAFSNPVDFSGGIVSVDPDTYEVEMIVDDGDQDEHPYGNISGMTVVSATRGYFVTYAGWGDNAIYGFNPTTGVVDESALAAFPLNPTPDEPDSGTNIANMNVDGQGNLWVASNTSSGGGLLTIINPADDSVDQEQSLELNPQGIAFGTWE
ncbi:MAG: hypothetical protein U9N63_00715 [Pseudomonadota bacterium]|nr:hypothetical protein [Pseudomonadota bacterium]